jgi:S-DNA-T family DNA segregation ATPase FtsK/SpoIIIE
MTSFPRPTPGRPLRVVLPRPPQPSPPHSFPFLATLAPVIASLALWSITSSPFALMFAALGPVIAIASVGDAGITSRRARRKENERFERDRAATRSAIDRIHARERRELESLAPGAHHLVTSSSHDPEHWRSVAGAPVPVRLGQGAVPSLIELPDDTDDTLLDLCAAASSVPAAPVVVDARLGIGLCGPRPLAVAAARALVVQLAAALSPAVTRVSASAGASDGATTGASAWDWLERLPHQTADPVAQSNAPPGVTTVVFTAVSPATAPEPITVAVADSPDHLPRQARVAVRVGAGESVILRHPDPAVTGVVRSEFVSLEEVLAWAEGQTDLARREGVLPPAALLPDLVELGGILATSRTPRGSDGSPDAGQGVAGAGDLLGGIGAAEDGVLAVDLVHDGPHEVERANCWSPGCSPWPPGGRHPSSASSAWTSRAGRPSKRCATCRTAWG